MALLACGECGNQVSDKAGSCPKCGAPVSGAALAPTSRATPPPVQQETVYYSDQSGIRVTNVRAIFGNKTYSMANVSSVALHIVPAHRLIPVLMAAGGALLTLVAMSEKGHDIGCPAMVFGVGIFLLLVMKDVWLCGRRPVDFRFNICEF